MIRAGSGARELLAGSEVEATLNGEERAVGAVARVVEINRAEERAAHGISEERVDLGFRDFEGDEDFFRVFTLPLGDGSSANWTKGSGPEYSRSRPSMTLGLPFSTSRQWRIVF